MDFKPIFTLTVCLISATLAWELRGKNAVAFTDSLASIKCEIEPEANYTGKVFKSWKDSSGELLFFKEEKVQATDRMTALNTDTEMEMQIDSTRLEDEGSYECSLLGMTPPVHEYVRLTVYQYPQDVYVENYDLSVEDGNSAALAKCIATGSKPSPTMWFTDENGDKIEVDGEMEKEEQSDGTVNTALTLERVFNKRDHSSVYSCHVRHEDGTVFTNTSAPVDVTYSTTMKLSDPDISYKMLEEGQPFEIVCHTDGNPTPTVRWIFAPDSTTNISMPADQVVPSNFEITGGRLTTSAVSLTDTATTNNGTFECKASNGIGEAVSKSFRLGVYAVPVTTVPTTTEGTPLMEPRSAGSDAAVIGGVVAVAVFVVIVAIVLVVRYFTSHKGTYRTHEVKAQDLEGDRRDDMDDDNLMGDEDIDQELGGRKRTEYFM